jgi:hypothetical protein
MMFGSLRLLTVEGGQVTGTTALGKAYARLTARLADATRVQRIAVGDDPSVFVVAVSRSRGAPLMVAWRKPADPVLDAPLAPARLPWTAPVAHATTLLDEPVSMRPEGGEIELQLGSEPVFIE